MKSGLIRATISTRTSHLRHTQKSFSHFDKNGAALHKYREQLTADKYFFFTLSLYLLPRFAIPQSL